MGDSLNRKWENIIEVVIAVFLIIYMGYSLSVVAKLAYDFETLKNYEIMSLCISLIPLILSLVLALKRKSYRRLDFLLVVIIISGVLISYICSVDKSISLFGRIYRCEGLVFLLAYYFYYLASREITNGKLRGAIVLMFLVVVFANVGYAVLQMFSSLAHKFNIDVVLMFKDATGLVGNPNFLSTIVVFGLFVILGYYLFSKKYGILILGYFGSMICFYVLLLAGSLSGIVAFISTMFLMLIFGVIYFFWKNNDRYEGIFFLIKFLAFIPAIIMCFIVAERLNDNHVRSDLSGMFVEVTDGLPEEAGTNRIYIWKNTIAILPKYILTGSGIDTFKEAFLDEYLVIESIDAVVDKAHNEYLQIALTEGIIPLLGYMGLIFYTLVKFIRRFRKETLMVTDIALVFAILAYLTQAIFNIRVIQIAPLFFILFGLVNYKDYSV